MSYCTGQDLIDEYGEAELIQLTDRSGSGSVDTTVLNAALVKATAMIDQRLRAKGWSLPLTVASNDLKELEKAITRFYLHGHLNEIPKSVQFDFDLAIKTLSDYVKGLIEFDLGSVSNNSSSSAGDVDFSAPERVFTPDSLAGF